MPDLNELLQSEQAKRLMNDKEAIRNVQNAPETQRLMEKLNQQAGGNLDAAKGDSKKLMGAVEKVLRDPESQRLLEQISKSFHLK